MNSNGSNRESFGRKRSQTTSATNHAIQSLFNGGASAISQPNSSSINSNIATKHSSIGAPERQNNRNSSGQNPGNQTGGLRQSMSQEKPKFVSLYERTLSLISRLYSVPDFEYYLFPGGINSLLNGDASPVIDPISILWNCFRLGAPFCHLINQLKPKTVLNVPDVSGVTVYSNLCKKSVYQFLVGAKEELKVTDAELFTISELYKDDTNGLVKVLDVVESVLDEIQKRGFAPPQKQFPFALGHVSQSAQDNRSKAIAELLSTERNYIQSLQELLSFQEELEHASIVSKDIIHSIFSNLHELLDFQRRFLFSLEATLALPSQDQNIGAIFIQYEDGFQVYHPMCASYTKAIQLALEHQQVLSGGSIDPLSLQGYLIKPVQRICRYPLLLKEIVKLSTPESFQYYSDLKAGELVMKKVADQVNEVQRMAENRDIKEGLLKKINDLQSMNPAEWGDLLLYDTFPMVAKDVEQMYHIYLFELLVLCCKETPKRDSLRSRKSRDGKAETLFEIKGKIYATSISDVVDISNPIASKFGVKVFWNDMEESFSLKCRNAEQAELWAGRIYASATGNTKSFKKARPFSDNRGGGMERTFSQGPPRRGGPNEHDARTTSMPPQIRARTSTSESLERLKKSAPNSASSIPNDYKSSFSTRRASNSANSMSVAGLPNALYELGLGGGPSKAPTGSLPPPPMNGMPPPSTSLPPPPRTTVNNDNGNNRPPSFSYRSTSLEQGHPPPRSSLPVPPTSSLPGPPPSELPPPPGQLNIPPRTSQSQVPPSSDIMAPPRANLPQAPRGVLPQAPRSNLPQAPSSDSSAPPRSMLPQPPSLDLPIPPPSASLPQPPSKSVPQPPTLPSHSSVTSLASQTRGGSGASSPRGSPRPSHSSPVGLMKMKTHYGTDIFVLAVPASGARFDDILEKIERKIKISGSALPQGRRIKIRYRDEDGDFITINSDDDVEMAFELARRTNEKGTVTLQAE